MSSSESSQPLSDCQQITFVMHNRFWLLSKNLLTPPRILNRQYQDGWNANQDYMEKANLFYIVFQALRRYFGETLQDKATSSFIYCFTTF